MIGRPSQPLPPDQPRPLTPLRGNSTDKPAELPFHSISLAGTTSSLASAQTVVSAPTKRVDPRVAQGLLKGVLVVFGALSLAQFAVAAAFFIHPLQFSIATQNERKSVGLTILPTVANVTNKSADLWLGAAVALVGLWAWERHLGRKGTTLDEMEAWGCLLAGDIPFTVLNIARLGFVPVTIFLSVVVLMTAATSGFTNAVTPAPGKVTVQRLFNVPSLFASDPQGAGLACARDDGSACTQNSQRGFVLDSINSILGGIDQVNFLGVFVNTSAMGIANPGVLATYVEQSDVRGSKYSSQASFVQAMMCMEGITTQPNCTGVPEGTPPPVLTVQADGVPATNTSAIWNVAYTNACGRPTTSFPLSSDAFGSMDVSACVDAQNQAHIDWVFFGSYAGNTTDNSTSLQVQCEINIIQSSMEMNLSRDEGTTIITPSLKPKPCPLTPNPINIVPNLTSQVGAVLATITDLDGGLLAVAGAPDDVDPIPYLESLSGMLFASVYTLDAFFGITFTNDDPDNADLVNYGGGGVPGYVVPVAERYTVVLLGDGSKAWLLPLGVAMALILLSFTTFFRKLLAFDPSDAGAVAAVALNSRVALAPGGEGGLATDEDAGRRMWFGEREGEPGTLTLGLEPRAIVRRKDVQKGGDLGEKEGQL